MCELVRLSRVAVFAAKNQRLQNSFFKLPSIKLRSSSSLKLPLKPLKTLQSNP